MKKLNIPLIPVITGSLALIAVIAVMIVLFGGKSSAGLYITEATGTVGITSADESVQADSSASLKEGDVITVGEGASCKIVYRTKKNADDIYMVLSENTQAVLTAEPKSKDGGELLLNRGSVICNFTELDKTQINIRTADAKIYPSGTVSKVAWLTEEFSSYTDVYAFMGNAKIQLYDVQGNAVNTPEFLAEKLAGRVTTNDLGPVFSYLNIQFPLTDLTAKDLKNLITISQLNENFTYTTDELKAAYSNVSGGEDIEAETTVTSSEAIQTAEPIETTSTDLVTDEPNHEITLPNSNNTTTSATTQPQTTTTTAKPAETTSGNDGDIEETPEPTDPSTTHTVTIIIGEDEIVQEVEHGGSADMPADPEISGKTFVGWDKDYSNITEDTVITAIFKDGDSTGTDVYHNVTIVIADRETTIQVKDGEAAPLPSTVNIEGYTFKGWDKDYSSIHSDMTITAILEPNSTVKTQYTVTFMVGGIPYLTLVEAGGNAIAPITPTVDAEGNEFIGWDKSLLNINSDMTITAMFASPEYTVTFVVEGISYPVKVKKGETAVVPVNPTTDSLGRTFIGWDSSFTNVQSDLTVNAIFM
ncbi:MAG: InlB B-repeat-containing protein [Oscillospiraceae bacterium]|nr:InlB B-repeat-containing protein [Oscillospiraceae bacterium]